MATQQEDVEKADNNAAFAKSLELESQANTDWAVTALFYSGLHYVEAYLAKVGALPHTHNTHGKRDKLVVLDGKLSKIRNEYFDLKNFGLQARYECQRIAEEEVTAAAIPALESIQRHIKKIL